VISRAILDFLDALGWRIGEIVTYDAVPAYAENAARHAARMAYRSSVAPSLEAAITGSDLVVFATTAGAPYVLDPDLLVPGQNVLNISLRDLAPELIAGAHNVLDDIDHCLNAGTSPHLAVQRYGHRDFIDGTIAQLLLGEIELTGSKPRVFSPFGLGVLDLAVGTDIFRSALETGTATAIPDFFAELERW
jgi:ornithine cyclodeaminase